MDSTKKMKARLNEVSPSFCLAKWKQVTIHLQSGLTHSCHHPSPHKIRLDEIAENPSALHNTSIKKYQRKLMREGKRPSECQYCWNIENAAGEQLSDRYFKSNDSWAEPHFKEVVESPWDANVFPSYVEVSFGNTCNFKCSYCSPSFSSTWVEEIRAHGPYKMSTPYNCLDVLAKLNRLPLLGSEPNPYLDAFWKWWPDLYEHLRVFRITGGEPLLAPSTFRVLDYVKANPSPQLRLGINSNFGGPEQLISKFIEAIKPLLRERKVGDLTLFTSIDTWGAQAEYIRHGLKFDYFWNNVETVLSEVPGLRLVFMSTFNALSVPHYQRLLEGVLKLRSRYPDTDGPKIILDLPYLHYPAHQSVTVLTTDFKEQVAKLVAFMETTAFAQKEVEGMKRIHAWMGSLVDPDQIKIRRADFYRFFSEHDRRRGTSFTDTFPEMKQFWELCAYAAGLTPGK